MIPSRPRFCSRSRPGPLHVPRQSLRADELERGILNGPAWRRPVPGEALRIFVDTIVYWYVGIGGGFIFISALVALVWRDTRAELVSQILNATGTMIAAYGAILAVDQWRQALVGF